MNIKLKLHFLVLLAALTVPTVARAQGTAFGYQGRLNDGGLPATGLYDFTFAVFDTEAGPPALGPTLVRDAVPVTNGLFHVALDFGGIFPGTPRWLEIALRPNGVGVPQVLTPRTALLPAPYAIYAGRAGYVDDGVLTVDHFDTGGLAPAPGQFLSYDGGNLVWSDPGVVVGDIFSLNGTSAYYNAGNVGIGTSTPRHRLSLAGGPTWTANGWIGAIALPTASAIGWQANAGGQRFGIGHSLGGLYLFRTASDPGTAASPAIYDFMISDAGNVGIGTITPGSKLEVRSDTSSAIVGRSTVIGGVGVYGESAQFNGVRGLAHNANHGGVVGVHDGGGIAVYGTGAVGVQGDGTSIGVYGRSTGGPAIHADGNATQARDKGGFVKAMVYVNASGAIVRAYNGVAGAATTVANPGGGVYFVDFGFRVSDRFISVTPERNFGDIQVSDNRGVNYRFAGFSDRVIEVFTFDTDDPDDTSQGRFMMIVY